MTRKTPFTLTLAGMLGIGLAQLTQLRAEEVAPVSENEMPEAKPTPREHFERSRSHGSDRHRGRALDRRHFNPLHRPFFPGHGIPRGPAFRFHMAWRGNPGFSRPGFHRPPGGHDRRDDPRSAMRERFMEMMRKHHGDTKHRGDSKDRRDGDKAADSREEMMKRFAEMRKRHEESKGEDAKRADPREEMRERFMEMMRERHGKGSDRHGPPHHRPGPAAGPRHRPEPKGEEKDARHHERGDRESDGKTAGEKASEGDAPVKKADEKKAQDKKTDEKAKPDPEKRGDGKRPTSDEVGRVVLEA